MATTTVEIVFDDGSRLTIGVRGVHEVRHRSDEQAEPVRITLQGRSLSPGLAYGFTSLGQLAHALGSSGKHG